MSRLAKSDKFATYSPPPTGMDEPFVLHSLASEDIRGFGGVSEGNGGGNVISSAWATASSAVFVPFLLDEARTYKIIIWMNGTTVSGNVDAGVYDVTGTRIFSVGTQVQTGTNTTQQVTLTTATTLQPGRYFLALVADNTTGTYIKSSPPAPFARAAGMRSLASAFPLPASASTWVGSGLSAVPLVGISELGTL